MQRLIATALLLIGLSAAAIAQTLGPREFTDSVVQGLKAAVPGLTVTATGDLNLKVLRDGSTGIVNLADMYKLYLEQPDRREKIVQSLAAQLAKSSDPGHADRSRIVPIIKTREWLADLQQRYREQKSDQGPVFEDFNKELVVVYAEDGENGLRYLSSGEKLPIKRDKLRTAAIANLERIVPKIEVKKPVEEAPVFYLTGNGDYDSSLLLLDRIWTSGKINVTGDIVVAIPVRNVLLATGSRERNGIKALRVAAAKFVAEDPYPQTDVLFVYRKGRFVKFGRK